MAPKLAEYLVQNNLIEIFPTKPFKFLEDVTNEIVARRKAKLDVRDDFIQSMIDHEQNLSNSAGETDGLTEVDGKKLNVSLKKSLTAKEILAQAIMFMAAGYDTTATTLEFVTYNLAMHQEVQDTLLEEIDQVLKKHVKF